MSTRARFGRPPPRGHRCGVLCFEVSPCLPPSHTHTEKQQHTHTLTAPAGSFLMNRLNWSSYKLGLSSKGCINTLTPFMRVIKQPLLGVRGSRLGRDCPGWLMSLVGMVARLWAPEPWACSWEEAEEEEEEEGVAAYWALDSLVRQSQTNLLSNGAATTLVGSPSGIPPSAFLFLFFTALEYTLGMEKKKLVRKKWVRLNRCGSLGVIRAILNFCYMMRYTRAEFIVVH